MSDIGENSFRVFLLRSVGYLADDSSTKSAHLWVCWLRPALSLRHSSVPVGHRLVASASTLYGLARAVGTEKNLHDTSRATVRIPRRLSVYLTSMRRSNLIISSSRCLYGFRGITPLERSSRWRGAETPSGGVLSDVG